MKNIFINPEIEYLRAGWRIAIFFLILTGCRFVVTGPGIYLLKIVPWLNSSGMQEFFVYVGITVATWLMLRFVDKRPFVSIGLTLKKNSVKELSQGLLLGSGMMTLIFVVEYSFGIVHIEFHDLVFQQQLLIFGNSIFLYIIVGYGEELLFRGYILQIFAEGSNRFIAALSISALFAFAHAGNPNVSIFGLINICLAGIWLSLAYYKTNALWVPIGMHISWNFFQGFVFGFNVSGTSSDKEQISKAIQSGADWITGGTFGPEGGALATIIIIAGSVFIWYSPWISSNAAAWTYASWREDRKQQLLHRQNQIQA
ncbi:MAG: type II CAAX endopeptidase family protein [Bacteroidota bacterium]|nr:type II CAAX endopeptidase family protein [Bacteroidota bacterium]